VWFGLRLSWPRAIGDELLEIQSDFRENGFEVACGGGSHAQSTTDLSLDVVDGQGAVDLVRRTRIEKRATLRSIVRFSMKEFGV